MELFRVWGSIMIDDKDAIKKLKGIDSQAKNNKKSFDKVTKAVAATAAAFGAMAVAIGGKALKSAVDFEKQMANVATLLGGDVDKRIGELGESLKDLSKETGVSTGMLSDGLYQVVSAFGDTAESMGILETASKGAMAGNATVTDSVNLLSAVMKGYGDVSDEAAKKASDLAFNTVKLGQTTFPELAASMGKVIPLASTLSVSQEELFGVMATLTGVTGSTSEVTTQLRGVLTGVVKPTKDMTKAMKDAGYESASAAIESKGLSGFLDILTDATGGSSDQMAKMFGSAEALTAVLALTGSQSDIFTEKTKAMHDATGATTEAYERQQDTVAATWNRIKETMNVFLIDLGDKMLPKLEELLAWFMEKMPEIEKFVNDAFTTIGNVISWVTDNANWLIPVLTTLVSTFVALHVIGAVSHALVFLKGVMVAVTTAGGIMNAVLALNPAVLIAVGIGVLIGGLVALVMNFDKVKEGASKLWDGIKNFFGKIRDFVSGIFEGFRNVIKLPKLSIEGSLNPVKWLKQGLPKLKVKWNAEGGIFDTPTIFGTQYGAQGVGEAGPEAIMPISKLQDMVDWNSGNEIDYGRMGSELKKALVGMRIVLDRKEVGEFVDARIIKGVM